MTKKGCLFGAVLALSLPIGAAEDFQTLYKESTTAKIFRAGRCPEPSGSSQACRIDIEAGDACESISLQWDDLHVNPDVKIIWNVNPNQWSFVDYGIRFKDSRAPFTLVGQGPKVRVWKSNRVAPTGTRYSYWVKLKHSSGLVCEFDPGVWL